MATQIGLVNYLSLKAAGAITGISLGTDGDTITVTSKQFDPNTGAPLSDLVTLWSLTDVNNQVAAVNGQLTNFNAVITDANANKQAAPVSSGSGSSSGASS